MPKQVNESDGELLVRMSGIHKRFGNVEVLRDARFDVFGGEVHILAGENGAGKSTLIKILAGVYPDYDGSIEIEGKSVQPRSPREAANLGVAVIYQELSLVPSMSVSDNLFLGRTETSLAGLVRNRHQRNEAQRLMEQLGLDIDVDRLAGELSIGTQQLVEIAKALGQNAKVIVMDEPTSALTAPEVEKLFSLIEHLKEQGRGIVYITHKMEEIDRIADRITVFRDGEFVATAPASDVPTPKLIEWMVGREMDKHFPRHRARAGEERLRIENFVVDDQRRGYGPVVDGVSLSVRAGEILGVGGLQGSGASELLMGLFGGAGRRARGRVWLDGKPIDLAQPHRMIGQGVALLTNDRQATGLVLSLSVTANSTLADLDALSWHGWRRPKAERRAAAELAKSLNLRAASLEMAVGALSGGNQQKVAMAKWLQTRPRLLLLDEPTRGIDIGAKHEVYELINQWTAEGIAIILITSEMPELLALSDRIVVMHRGRLTAEFGCDAQSDLEAATADRILEAAMGKEMESLVL